MAITGHTTSVSRDVKLIIWKQLKNSSIQKQDSSQSKCLQSYMSIIIKYTLTKGIVTLPSTVLSLHVKYLRVFGQTICDDKLAVKLRKNSEMLTLSLLIFVHEQTANKLCSKTTIHICKAKFSP